MAATSPSPEEAVDFPAAAKGDANEENDAKEDCGLDGVERLTLLVSSEATVLEGGAAAKGEETDEKEENVDCAFGFCCECDTSASR